MKKSCEKPRIPSKYYPFDFTLGLKKETYHFFKKRGVKHKDIQRVGLSSTNYSSLNKYKKFQKDEFVTLNGCKAD